MNEKKIKQVLDFVINNPYSDFYKNKYGKLGTKLENIKTYTDFQKIPFLTKEEILKTALEKRIFIAKDKITHYAFTSGSANKPLVIPHSYKNDIAPKFKKYIFNEEKLKKIGVRNFLVLFPPTTILSTMLPIIPKKYTVAILGDTNKLNITALLTKEVDIQGLVTSPTILYFFLKELNKIKFDYNIIKWIRLAGEACTAQKLSYFKSQFPKAMIDFHYGTAELASGWIPRGYQCEYLNNLNPDIYHLNPFYLTEILNEKGVLLNEDELGEIVHTDLFPGRAFPLIRYKTGDTGFLKKKKCKCGQGYILKLGGRKYFDFLNFHGVTLYTHIIENSLDSVRHFIEPYFQMHVYEKLIGNKIMPQLILDVSLKNKHADLEIIKKKIISNVNDKLLLASKKNLRYFVENKLFLPLKVKFVDFRPTKEFKTKHIVSHLN